MIITPSTTSSASRQPNSFNKRLIKTSTRLLLSTLLLLSLFTNHLTASSESELYHDGVTTDIEGAPSLVTIPQGSLAGVTRAGLLKEDHLYELVDWFLGIPFAMAPVGALRFKKPERAEGWEGVRRAVRYGATCLMSFDDMEFVRLAHNNQEDCLFLNVFTPLQALLTNQGTDRQTHQTKVLAQERPKYLLPVMLFIHGGSYEFGSGSIYVGDTLAQFGVVVVTINYRLGMLGFLSANSRHLRGNYGLHDQIAALRWVQENIAYFAGDPSRVTIFGNSAGAASVGILAVSSVAKGLFQNAIIQSGSPLAYWSYYRQNDADLKERFKQIASLANCSGGADDDDAAVNSANALNRDNDDGEEEDEDEDVKAMVACLRTLNRKHIFTNIYVAMGLPSIKPTKDDDLPCIDGEVLTTSLEEAFARGSFHVDNLMIGMVSNEWSHHLGTYTSDYEQDMKPSDKEPKEELYKSTLKYVLQKKLRYSKELSELAHYMYFPRHLKDVSTIRDQYIKFVSDISFLVPSINYARMVNDHSNKSRVFFYVYDHHSNESKEHWKNNYHTIELKYIFGCPFRKDNMVSDYLQDYTQEDKESSIYMMKLWTNFAKSGDPKRGSSDETNVVLAWEKFDGEDLNYANLSRQQNSQVSSNIRSHYVEFWNRVVPKINNLAASNQLNLQALKKKANMKNDALYIAAIVILTTLTAALAIALFSVCLKSKLKDSEP